MNKAVLSVLILSYLLVSCAHKTVPPPAATPVNLLEVSAKNVLYYDNYPATTTALSQVDLHAQVTGNITGIYFTEGTHVRKGQKLYVIDERLYTAAYDQAKANLQVSEGNLKQAQQDADRYQYLNKYNAVATQLVDHAVIALQNAKNDVKASEQAVKTAQTNLIYATIYAPFDGTIGFSQVKLGNLVSVGTTVLNTISTDDPMAVDFVVNEADLSHFKDLQMRKQQTIDSLFTIILPNHSIYPHLGKISVIDRAVDAQTGTIRVRLVFPNPNQYLVVGMSCITRVHNQEGIPKMLIPSKAIVEQMGEYFVYVAKDTVMVDSASKKGDAGSGSGATAKGGDDVAAKGDGNSKDGGDSVRGPKLRAFQKKVMLGQTIGANVIVESGIEEGDKIVVDGVQALHDGSSITTSNKPGPAQKH